MIKMLAKPVADSILDQVRKRTQSFIQTHHRKPKLSVVLVGEDPASVIYTRKKGEAAVFSGMEHETIRLPAKSTPDQVKAKIEELNRDPRVDGILIQRPLPKGFREEDVLFWVSPEKDVDAFHPIHAGELFLGIPTFQPCTPAGIMEILKYYKIQISGTIACVVGRSSIVGKPMASLLLQANATVLHCHSQTPDLKSLTRQADILVVAIGKPGFINKSYIKPGAVVIDVGMHRNEDGRVQGDVLYDDVEPLVSAITPVPGGVGPMTISILMNNTIRAAEKRQGC